MADDTPKTLSETLRGLSFGRFQAIETRYLGPTNHRGARVKATAYALTMGSVTLSWDHALTSEHNHAVAACTLAVRLGWLGNAGPVAGTATPMPLTDAVRAFADQWIGGILAGGKGYAFTRREPGGKS